MKRSLISLLVILLSGHVCAQTYVPFPTERVVWKESYNWSYGFLDRSICEYTNTYSIKDTLIDSLTYYELIINKVTYSGSFMNCTIDTFRYKGVLGYFRNDSINRKVWLRLPNSNRDTLFYDFDLELGDTLQPTYVFPDSGILAAPQILVVDSIDTVNYGGINRRRYSIKWPPSYSTLDSFRIIEGIGGEKSFLDPFVYGYGFANYKLDCMGAMNTTIYSYSPRSCNLITGLSESQIKHEPKIDLFPNPTKTHLNLLTGKHKILQSVSIFDILGRKQEIELFELGQNHYQLDLKELSNGIYIINTSFKDGSFLSKKILKQ